MPRRPRVFVEGVLYHGYNRFARAEGVFGDPEEAIDFVGSSRGAKSRDGVNVPESWPGCSEKIRLR